MFFSKSDFVISFTQKETGKIEEEREIHRKKEREREREREDGIDGVIHRVRERERRGESEKVFFWLSQFCYFVVPGDFLMH